MIVNEVQQGSGDSQETSFPSRLRELAFLFLKLGAISFGGPAAHIALIETEIVHKRRWVTGQQFLDMVGAASLIPGPTSTETAITTGFVRAGWPGLCVAGVSFILPAALITGAFAWAYVRFGNLPQAISVLAGIKPAVVAIIAIAIWRLGKTAVKDVGLAGLGVLSLAAFFFGLNPIIILFGGGALGMLVRKTAVSGSPSAFLPILRPRGSPSSLRWIAAATLASVATGAVAIRPSIAQIGLFFLKVGAVLYGGGYVLGGAQGAAVATVGIFLPSFFYVALLAPVLFRLRKSTWIAAFLDSVNVCAVALMAGVTFRLGVDALRTWPSWVIALASFAVLLRWKISPAWIVLGGGIAGFLLAAFR